MGHAPPGRAGLNLAASISRGGWDSASLFEAAVRPAKGPRADDWRKDRDRGDWQEARPISAHHGRCSKVSRMEGSSHQQ